MAQRELDTEVNQALSNNSNLFSVFFDIENAFPRVWMDHIAREYTEQAYDFLPERHFRVREESHCSTVYLQLSKYN